MAASYPAFHVGEVGVAYAPLTPNATGGVQPYEWTVSAGALPPGVNLGNDGSVSGTPTGAGTYAFTITAADSGDGTVPISGQINVANHIQATLLPACALQCSVELGCVTVCGPFGTLGAGVSPYSYALIAGQLPAGTLLDGLALAGTFVGLPGYLRFTVQVTDAIGATATITPTFWMYPHVSLANGTCFSYGYLFPCSASLPFSGGIPSTTFSVGVVSATGSFCTPAVTGGWTCKPTTSPPPMFTASVGDGVVNVSVPSQPNNPYAYFGTVTLGLNDQDPCAPGANCRTTATVQVTFGG